MPQVSTVACLRRLLDASCQTGGTTLFPSLLIALPGNELDEIRKPGVTMADLAIRYFRGLGLRCDRTMAGPSLNGYPGRFRDLSTAPPWVEVTPEDVEGAVSTEREAELRPLYLQANQMDPQLLLQKYRDLREFRSAPLKQLGLATPPEMTDVSVEIFQEELELARCLGVAQFETILDSIQGDFDEPLDEFTTQQGAPDLFVWSEVPHLWFFAEVKGPGDSLRGSQGDWIRYHWEAITGRFVLVLIHEA